MDPNLFLAFCLATTVMILLPGPSVMLTVAHSLAHGWRKALLTVLGATGGVAVQLAVAIVGMTSFLLFMAEWFEWLRWLGVAYLVYLGIQQWRSPPAPPETERGRRSGRSLFAQGFLVTLANPKSLVFLAAFFPQFVDPAAPPVLQFGLMGLSFLAITYLFTGLWAVLADRSRPLFRSLRAIRLRNRIAGGLLVGAGLGLALARRG